LRFVAFSIATDISALMRAPRRTLFTIVCEYPMAFASFISEPKWAIAISIGRGRAMPRLKQQNLSHVNSIYC
jgi:hypothetical protein